MIILIIIAKRQQKNCIVKILSLKKWRDEFVDNETLSWLHDLYLKIWRTKGFRQKKI